MSAGEIEIKCKIKGKLVLEKTVNLLKVFAGIIG